ncbi:MAG: gluconokinase [Actinomycetota bacterium]
MSDQVVIGLDLGTTSIKAVALDASGRAHGVVQHEAPPHRDASGRSEQDPELVVAAVKRCLREVTAKAADAGLTVAGVATSAAMHSLMAVDADNEPLTGGITWGDRRAVDQARRIKQEHDHLAIYKRTGVPLHPMTPLTKLMWFRENESDLYARAARWVSMKEHVQHRLCGEWFVDRSTASTSGLLSLETLDWDDELLDVLALERAKLSPVVDSTYRGGTIRPDAASELGLPTDCAVVAGASDGALANIGVGALTDGVVACSIGTSGAVRVLSTRPLLDPHGRLFCYPFEDHFLVGGSINNGGVALQWVRDQFFSELVDIELEGGMSAYEALDELASSVPPGADGLLFLPYLLGERAPYWNPDARGVMFGLTMQHGRAHLVRAALEGVIHQMNLVVELLEGLIGDVTEVRVTGGFARSSVWCQIMADICRHRVLVPVSEQGSAFGAAAVGLKALGLTTSFDLPETGRTGRFEPTPALEAVYRPASARFARLYGALEGEFASAAQERSGGERL